jgi:hypothetical protein
VTCTNVSPSLTPVCGLLCGKQKRIHHEHERLKERMHAFENSEKVRQHKSLIESLKEELLNLCDIAA